MNIRGDQIRAVDGWKCGEKPCNPTMSAIHVRPIAARRKPFGLPFTMHEER